MNGPYRTAHSFSEEKIKIPMNIKHKEAIGCSIIGTSIILVSLAIGLKWSSLEDPMKLAVIFSFLP